MNDMQYDDLLKVVSNIKEFRGLVQSESKRPIAVRLLKHLAGITEHEAWEFIDDYYANMDISFNSRMIGDKLKSANLKR